MERERIEQISEGRRIVFRDRDAQSRFRVSGRSTTEHSLEIARVEPHDMGIYICTLLSSPETHISYQLVVFQPPVFLAEKSSALNSLSVGQLGLSENVTQINVVLCCVGSGLPATTTNWWLAQQRLAITDGDPTLTYTLVKSNTALSTGFC